MRWTGKGTGRAGRLLVSQRVGHGVAALLVLNAADAAFTAALLRRGLAQEANPLMRVAWEASPLLFFGLKMALVGSAALLLVRYCEHLAAGVTLYLGLIAYAVVVGYHLAFWVNLLLPWSTAFPS
ncbi:MAG: hypothetical protein HY901_02140 [Deltaproteobacteria bacterium]|nr:hypothetical protein [Deltaproteobacteria bacterium]